VSALALGLLLLAIHPCLGKAGAVAKAAGWALVGLYFALMAIWKLLDWIGLCNTDECEAAGIHAAILGPLGALLGLLSWILKPCFWGPVWWIYSSISGFWAFIGGACLLRR
jgi:hypothetical protein